MYVHPSIECSGEQMERHKIPNSMSLDNFTSDVSEFKSNTDKISQKLKETKTRAHSRTFQELLSSLKITTKLPTQGTNSQKTAQFASPTKSSQQIEQTFEISGQRTDSSLILR